MRILRFSAGERPARIGILNPRQPDEVIDAGDALAGLGLGDAADLLRLIDAGAAALEALDGAVANRHARSYPLAGITVLAPLAPPRGNVIAVGRNYQKHAEERARALGGETQAPTVFTKAITSIAGPYDAITLDASVSDRIDWEAELGVVMARRRINIARAEALSHVFGYTVLNDVTARDIQQGWGGQFFKGKSLDGYCPIGPWIVTADEIPDPQSLTIRLRVNGETKQEATTRDMIYPVDAILEWISRGMTLLPGTLVATGTPEGIGSARNPPEFLRPGDIMETEIEGIGTLRNEVVAGDFAKRSG